MHMPSIIYFSQQPCEVVSIIPILQMRILALREVMSCSTMAKLESEHWLLNAITEELTAPVIAYPLTRIKMSKQHSPQWRSSWNSLLVALGFSSLSLWSPHCSSFLIQVQYHYHWVMLKVGILKVVQAGLVSWVCNLCGFTGVHIQNTLCFVQCSTVMVLKLLTIYLWTCML